MFQVQCLESHTAIATEQYSKYSIGPFKQGQSTTIGNTLRRVLLSNLQGISIVGVRITGVNHEFSTIPNVKEDVIDILLNLKQIILKGEITEPVIARLTVKNSGIITADNIELPDKLSFVDSQQYIATLNNNGNLEMEFLITRGQNYFSNGAIDTILPTGFLSVDAVFMPVKKVNFFIETSKSNSNSELESLILEIWTNGSITPSEALSCSSEILEQTFQSLKITDTTSLMESTKSSSPDEEIIEPSENVFIEELELSVRAYNCLKRANVHTIKDLLQYSATDLLEFKNFGQKSADEVCESLQKKFSVSLQK